MDPNFDLPVFSKFEAPWVEDLPYMPETCNEALGLLGCVLKRLKILVKFNHREPGGKNGSKFRSVSFAKFEAPWVEALPYMLETCRGGPRPIRLCVEKTKYFGQIQPPRTWRPKWTQILIGPFFPKFAAPWVEDLPFMLETCRGGPRPIKLCVEKTKNFGQIQPPRTWRPKWTQILIGPFSPNLKPLE